MKQEDKELLLVDLCARLPYGVIGLYTWKNKRSYDKELTGNLYDELKSSWNSTEDSQFLPYLRPMSSMTEEEKHYIDNRWGADNYGDIITYSSYEGGMSTVELADIIGFQDWLNAHHFDYRNLIEKGLAFEAPEGMYKEEQQ